MDREVQEPMYAESDKVWDAMHRVLSNGLLSWEGGLYPLNHAILAGELLYTGSDYIMSLKSPEQVKDVAAALDSINQQGFRERYFLLDAEDYGSPLTEEDLADTWEWFQSVRDLYRTASGVGRHVLFTADQ